MQISLGDIILRKFPMTEIGYLVANVKITSNMTTFIGGKLGNPFKNVEGQGTNATNFFAQLRLVVRTTLLIQGGC